MPEGHHPPAPGSIVQPNVSAIENALRDITFPISKKDMIDQIADEDTIVLAGRNVELRQLVRDLPDDFFESEDEFREHLESAMLEGAEAITVPSPPTGFPEEMPLQAPGASDQPALPEDNA
jgi:hypothetical protein